MIWLAIAAIGFVGAIVLVGAVYLWKINQPGP